MKNAAIPNPKPSSDIRTFSLNSRVSKSTSYSRRQRSQQRHLVRRNCHWLKLSITAPFLVLVSCLCKDFNVLWFSIFAPDFSMRHFKIFMERLQPSCYFDTVISIFLCLVPYLLYLAFYFLVIISNKKTLCVLIIAMICSNLASLWKC